MRIERHIFGSYSGYTTLARSPGVTAEDCRTLESGAYAFGQSNDRHFTRTLAKSPAYFTRLLAGGRRGLTRVLEGAPDDNNRPTLCLITLVISQRDWDGELWGDVGPLLENPDLWQWDGSQQLPPLDVAPAVPGRALSRRSVPKVLALISEVEQAVAARRSVLVCLDDYGAAELRAVEMLVPPAARRQFTSAYRSLSPQLPVTVNCLAAEAASLGRPTFRYSAGADHLSPYARFLEGTELSDGTLPIESVLEYRGFAAGDRAAGGTVPGAAEESGAAAPPSVRVVRKPAAVWPMIVVGVLAVLVAVGAFVGGKSVGTRDARAAAEERLQAERVKADNDKAAAVAATRIEEGAARSKEQARYEEQLRAALGQQGAQGYDELINALKARLADAKARQGEADKLSQREAKLLEFYEDVKGRERQRVELARTEMNYIAGTINLGTLADPDEAVRRAERERLAQQVARVLAELNAVTDKWLTKEDGAAVNEEVRRLRQRADEISEGAGKVVGIVAISQTCDQRRREYTDAAARDVVGNVEAHTRELERAVRELPPSMAGVDLGEFKKQRTEEVKRLRQWVNEKAKAVAAAANPKPPHDPGKDPPRDPKAGGDRPRNQDPKHNGKPGGRDGGGGGRGEGGGAGRAEEKPAEKKAALSKFEADAAKWKAEQDQRQRREADEK